MITQNLVLIILILILSPFHFSFSSDGVSTYRQRFAQKFLATQDLSKYQREDLEEIARNIGLPEDYFISWATTTTTSTTAGFNVNINFMPRSTAITSTAQPMSPAVELADKNHCSPEINQNNTINSTTSQWLAVAGCIALIVASFLLIATVILLRANQRAWFTTGVSAF